MNVLVTRPRGKGESLVQLLRPLVSSVHYQPMLEIQPGPDFDALPELLTRSQAEQVIDMLIFVSGSAVDYFTSRVAASSLSGSVSIVAVGAATAAKLQQWTSQPVITPEVETSEGLLALSLLQPDQISGKSIVIVRGVGGRELLSEQLQSRGAKTFYWQLYQRVAVTDKQGVWLAQWQSQQIDCIVITSVAILTALLKSLPTTALPWLCQITWLVASDRIAQALKQQLRKQVRQKGIPPTQIINVNGAGDQAVLTQVKRLIENNYGRATD